MPKANRSKSAAFSVRTCPHCGRKTRGPAHFRHEQACQRQARGRTMARPTTAGRGRGRRRAPHMGQFLAQLRRLVQEEIQRQLGVG